MGLWGALFRGSVQGVWSPAGVGRSVRGVRLCSGPAIAMHQVVPSTAMQILIGVRGSANGIPVTPPPHPPGIGVREKTPKNTWTILGNTWNEFGNT